MFQLGWKVRKPAKKKVSWGYFEIGGWRVTFFMMPDHCQNEFVKGQQGRKEVKGKKEDGPAFLFENVICRLDLS